MDRNLDGIYFRVQRDEKWGNTCFSDLTQEEMEVPLIVIDTNEINK